MENKQATPGVPEQARLGAYVAVELIDDQGAVEPLAFDIVREEHADFDRGLLGVQTPLAKAIIGKRIGAVVDYRRGDICKVRIVDVRASQLAALENTEEQRQAQLQKAVDAVERTNAEMFAASYSGKWGDYELSDETTDS